jgi:tripartite-type tricarboxylate transporter receptor subunit TctC
MLELFKRLGMALAALLVAGAAAAQDYPSRPVKIVVTFTPGGGADVSARMIGERLSDMWKQSVLVENRIGGGGNIGAEFVHKSPADGYTLLMLTASHTVNAALFEKPSFDLLKDFAPIGITTSSPVLIAVNNNVKANNTKELLELLRAQPGKFDYATCGIATTHHFAMELMKFETRTIALHIPHRGCAGAVSDAIGGQLQIVAVTLPAALPFVKQGRLRAIAVTSRERSPNAPDVPAVRESGVPALKDFAVENYYGFLAPGGTPKEIVSKIEADIRKVLSEPQLVNRLAAAGMDKFLLTPAETTAIMRADIERYKRVARHAGIKQE